jgi:MurNAc alpha-1-phosphate uridylyltransferase
MTDQPIAHGFITAAGYGKRLKPYTDSTPKPMVPLGGAPIIDQVMEKLLAAGVSHVTVNLHHMAEILGGHLAKKFPMATLSCEETLLDTGGGVKNALETMGGGAFFVVSGDSLWTDGPSGAALERLHAKWDPQKMDILLLLQPLAHMTLTEGVGDYDIRPDGRAVRSLNKTGAYMWTSVRICHARIFDDTPDDAFSFLPLMDRAEAAGRLYAIVHDGDWYHVTTPGDLERINAHLAAGKKAAAGS